MPQSDLQFLHDVATEVGALCNRCGKQRNKSVLGELYPIHNTIRKLTHNEKRMERQS